MPQPEATEFTAMGDDTRQSCNWRAAADAALVTAAKNGDGSAFDQLFERYARRVLRVAQRITRNVADAEDVVQECFLSAFTHLKKFDGRSRFSTWLTRIAINAALMNLRKNRPRREISIEAHDNAVEAARRSPFARSPLTPEECYWNRQRAAILKDEVARLQPIFRHAVDIHRLREMSLKETSQILGISVQATKARLFRARIALRNTSTLRFLAPPLQVARINKRQTTSTL